MRHVSVSVTADRFWAVTSVVEMPSAAASPAITAPRPCWVGVGEGTGVGLGVAEALAFAEGLGFAEGDAAADGEGDAAGNVGWAGSFENWMTTRFP